MHRLWRVRTGLPVTAIFPEDNVPEQWQNYIPMNYEHFGQSK